LRRIVPLNANRITITKAITTVTRMEMMVIAKMTITLPLLLLIQLNQVTTMTVMTARMTRILRLLLPSPLLPSQLHPSQTLLRQHPSLPIHRLLPNRTLLLSPTLLPSQLRPRRQ
jgi:hypothetical protein